MAAWGKWVAVVGGVIAILGQFMTGYYLAAVGGIAAVVGGLMS